MTKRAVYSVLRFIGLGHIGSTLIIGRHWGKYGGGSIASFEEIRHHELQYILEGVYIQRKYLGE